MMKNDPKNETEQKQMFAKVDEILKNQLLNNIIGKFSILQ